jgi:cytochrome c-type biogenesis protein CcmH/NrfG
MRNMKGNEFFKQKKYEDAAAAFERACEIAGPHPVYLSNAAAAYLKLDQ